METITAYEDLARLVTGHFHRGVRTNTMVSPEEYGPAIAAGTLRAQATPARLPPAGPGGPHPPHLLSGGSDRSPGRGAAPSHRHRSGFPPPGHRTSGDRLLSDRPGLCPCAGAASSLPPRGRDGRAGSPPFYPGAGGALLCAGLFAVQFLPPDRLPFPTGKNWTGTCARAVYSPWRKGARSQVCSTFPW